MFIYLVETFLTSDNICTGLNMGKSILSFYDLLSVEVHGVERVVDVEIANIFCG